MSRATTTKPKPKPKRAARKPGRPTKRTTAVVKRILGGLAKGIPLTILCEPNNMPDPSTVWEWGQKDAAFSQAIARAREAGFDRIAQDALEIADTPEIGEEITDTEDGRTVKRADMLGHRKLRVETRLKLLAKWDPKRYGEKISQEISGKDGAPLIPEQVAHTEAELAAFAAMMAKANAEAMAEGGG